MDKENVRTLHHIALYKHAMDSSISIISTVLYKLFATTFINLADWLIDHTLFSAFTFSLGKIACSPTRGNCQCPGTTYHTRRAVVYAENTTPFICILTTVWELHPAVRICIRSKNIQLLADNALNGRLHTWNSLNTCIELTTYTCSLTNKSVKKDAVNGT